MPSKGRVTSPKPAARFRPFDSVHPRVRLSLAVAGELMLIGGLSVIGVGVSGSIPDAGFDVGRFGAAAVG